MNRKHTLSEKAPWLSVILSMIFAVILCAIGMENGPSDTIKYTFMGVFGVLCLLLQRWWFLPEYEGAFKPVISVKEIKVLCIPFLVQLVLSYILNVIDYGFNFKPTVLSVAMAIAAGFGEETMFRGVTIPIGMRYLKGRNKILSIAIVTSVMFGLSHIGNAAVGANITMSVIQGIVTIGTGLFYAAVFLRSGSILIPVAMHCLYDWVCFVTDSSLENGIMASSNVAVTLILSGVLHLAMGVVGIYMIRPAMREKIEDVWRKKWSVDQVKENAE